MTDEATGTADLTAIARDPDAFEAFYRTHVESVQRFVARRVDDPYLTADLTADIFLSVIDSAHTYRPNAGPVVAWLFGVAGRAMVRLSSLPSSRSAARPPVGVPTMCTG